MKNKLTAVEWLVQQFNLQAYTPHIEQAKQMEKEQIMNAWISGDESDGISDVDNPYFALQYYNETYGN